MTTQVLVKAFQGTLTATLTTSLVTVASLTGAGKLLVKEVLLANTDTVARAVTLYMGTSAALGKTILPAVSVPANSAVAVTLSTVLNNGDTIFGGASVTNVVDITISGVTIT